MKKERLLLVCSAVIAGVMPFVPGLGSGFMDALSLPFTALGGCLRAMSLSGRAGNAAALILYVLVCGAPVWFWHRSRRQTADRLLLLLPLVLAVVLYYMVNPNLRGQASQNPVGDAVYACSVWSLLATWGVLKLVGSGSGHLDGNLYRALRIFLLLCAVGCLMNGIGKSVSSLRWYFGHYAGDYGFFVRNRNITLAFLTLEHLVKMAESILTAQVLCRGGALLTALEADPFSADCVRQAEKVSSKCREALVILSLSGLTVNLGQLLLATVLLDIQMEVRIPLLGLAVCFAMLAVTKLLVRGKELKDESDLFV